METTCTYRILLAENQELAAKMLLESASDDALFFISKEDVEEIEEKYLHNDQSGITVTYAENEDRKHGAEIIHEMIVTPASYRLVLIADGSPEDQVGSIIGIVNMDDVDVNIQYGLVSKPEKNGLYDICCISYI